MERVFKTLWGLPADPVGWVGLGGGGGGGGGVMTQWWWE